MFTFWFTAITVMAFSTSALMPLLFSVESSVSGNQRLAIILLLPMLALGMVLISQICPTRQPL